MNASPAPAARGPIELTFVGDVIFGRYRGDNIFDPIPGPNDHPFADIFETMRSDLLVGNLETPLTRDLPLTTRQVQTPLMTIDAPVIAGKKLAIVPILRAGIGMSDGLLELVPSARVGHVGVFRDPETHKPVEYLVRLPDTADRIFILCDPMVATGNSAAAAVTRLKACKPKSIKFLCLLTCPEGINTLYKAHPDVRVFTAAIDRGLNDHGYIMPGLGDAGDRIFGTQ